jgi:hypothetical protein
MRDTIDMAREAGMLGEFDTAQDIIECGIEVWLSGERGVQTLERFAALVASAEREACAKVCESEAEMFKSCAEGVNDGRYDWKEDGARDCAYAIRARRDVI